MHAAVLSDDEFNQFRTWLHLTTGISLSDSKKALLAGRLSKRLKHHGLSSYSEYLRLITRRTDAAEFQIALDLLTTNETYFFREPKHFDFLRGQILPKVQAGKKFRLWSAASSTGEEPYSLAMTLADGLCCTSWEIVASDISTRVLNKARTGQYDMDRAHNIPQSLLAKHCLKGTGTEEGTFMVERNLRSHMQFMRINLNTTLPNMGEFDVIFLRNVMIYFDRETKRQVVARILPFLKSGGYFIVSHSESLNGITDILKLVSPSIYRKP